MSKFEQSSPNDDGPKIRAETWFALAIASFAITLVIATLGALWVFGSDTDRLMVQRAQAFTPFGAAMLAAVTFFTVAWRGVLNTAQLQHAAEQLAQARRQNDAKDDENLAKLLQEGAKLVSETTKQSQVLAGIATLETLIADPKARFATHAMDLIADYIAASHQEAKLQRATNAAIRAMGSAAKLGLRSRVGIDFFTNNKKHRWRVVPGLSYCKYEGGTFHGREYAELARSERHVELDNVVLTRCPIERADRIIWKDCTFEWCTIRSFDGHYLDRNVFSRCDFSDATITEPFTGTFELNSASSGNYYDTGKPPNDGVNDDLMEWLTEEEPIPF
ncbi:hypothetical protein MYG64_04715 [Ensifer adhaerens]|uniref:hypothetical protein n=1 Tax=Ensifer adhaerens TaxID=106592 RepID=UPI002100A025|nr:hypothetical protein [Ensifer adhaerens]UTV37623.1 hypothetical protein MYG64_04715 [Ensifer adhaerens]